MIHLYIEDSAELQIYRPMLNKVHMHLYLYGISPNDHLPNLYRYGEGVGRGRAYTIWNTQSSTWPGFELMTSRS